MPETATFDHYEVLTRADGSLYELGRGAMGVTYKAFDTRLQYPVCLKVINAAYLKSEIVRQRFIREARSAAKLRHRNVATVFHLGTEGDRWYYAMEFIDGETLEAVIKREGVLDPKAALEITVQVARALNAAAQRGLVHRDIKPANLMLVHEDGEVLAKVIDFGLAKAPAEGEEEATLSMGGFVGTAQFASPEQLEERDLDVRSDIYSLGVTLWQMLAGRPPFRGSLAQVMNQQLSKPPPFDELPALPSEVIVLLRRMLEKNRANRFQTPVELRKAIESILYRLPAAPALEAPPPEQSLDPPAEPEETSIVSAAVVADQFPTPPPFPSEPALPDPILLGHDPADDSPPLLPVESPPPPPAEPLPLPRPAAALKKNLPLALIGGAVVAVLVVGVGGYFILPGLGRPKISDAPPPGPSLEATPGPTLKPAPSPGLTVARNLPPAPTPMRSPAPIPEPATPVPIDKLSVAVRAAEKLEDQGDNRAALEGYLRVMKDFPDTGAIAGRNHLETLLERLRAGEPAMTPNQFASMRDLIAQAGQQKVLSAMLLLGQRLKDSAPAESYRWIKNAADAGDAAASDTVGNMFLEGVPGVVAKDPVTASEYFQRAADKGNVRSKAALGQYYLEGYGGVRDEALGVRLLREAVAAGNPHAMNFLGDYLATKAKKRPERERKAARAEYEEAFRLFTDSKDLGDLKALANLGLLYMQGDVPGARGPDYKKAVALFARGAKSSDPFSMYSYARCLEDGIGIKKDPVEAQRWDIKAVNAGDKDFIKWSNDHKINMLGKPAP